MFWQAADHNTTGLYVDKGGERYELGFVQQFLFVYMCYLVHKDGSNTSLGGLADMASAKSHVEWNVRNLAPETAGLHVGHTP